eukprot:scaffold58824_cov45-Phaeocystis_antarctica.AAC.2
MHVTICARLKSNQRAHSESKAGGATWLCGVRRGYTPRYRPAPLGTGPPQPCAHPVALPPSQSGTCMRHAFTMHVHEHVHTPCTHPAR